MNTDTVPYSSCHGGMLKIILTKLLHISRIESHTYLPIHIFKTYKSHICTSVLTLTSAKYLSLGGKCSGPMSFTSPEGPTPCDKKTCFKLLHVPDFKFLF